MRVDDTGRDVTYTPAVSTSAEAYGVVLTTADEMSTASQLLQTMHIGGTVYEVVAGTPLPAVDGRERPHRGPAWVRRPGEGFAAYLERWHDEFAMPEENESGRELARMDRELGAPPDALDVPPADAAGH